MDNLVKSLDNFKAAYEELNEQFLSTDNAKLIEEISDDIAENYPLKESFDEAGISEWCDNLKTKIMKEGLRNV